MRKINIIKNEEKPIQKYRFTIQLIFALLCVWIGIEFFLFARYLESGGTASFYQRPPGVDGFLPISSLMSVYYFFLTGSVHQVHPAGFFIFIGIVATSFVFGKSFCSWLCPIGFLSELIGDFGEKLFGRKITVPKILDYPLRSLKYLILAFFSYTIFMEMDALTLKLFLDSPYNIVADLKLYYFFADITRFSIVVLSILFILSIIIRNFWCRYLCPYGALLGIFSLLSPNKIKRNASSCIDCGLCAKACPSTIKVDKVKIIISDECTTCMSCVDACPVADTLYLQPVKTKIVIKKRRVAYGIAGIFLIITAIGVIGGKWQNQITKKEYLLLNKNIERIGHVSSADEFDTNNSFSTNRKQIR
ncbi:MAG: 4Fe-4S binding protein [Ignavibacteria bacterium]|nr:4Fe-4S binding protein [Ignavibacteria bacterium]